MTLLYMTRSFGIAIMLLLLAESAVAKEVRVLIFSFEIPDAWYVDGHGGPMLFATAAAEMYRTPLIMSEACVSTATKDCAMGSDHPFPNDPSRHKEDYESLGCSGSAVTTIPRQNGILEQRLVCSRVVNSSGAFTVGYSLFKAKGAVLWIAYMAGDEDPSVTEFLDALARSLKTR